MTSLVASYCYNGFLLCIMAVAVYLIADFGWKIVEKRTTSEELHLCIVHTAVKGHQCYFLLTVIWYSISLVNGKVWLRNDAEG